MSIQLGQSRMILSLNCARRESSTYAVLSFVTKNPKYDILLLQEPWLNLNKKPPSLREFEMFTPVPTNSKCVTYIRISAQLQPPLSLSQSNTFLGVEIPTWLQAKVRQQLTADWFNQHPPDHLFPIRPSTTFPQELGQYSPNTIRAIFRVQSSTTPSGGRAMQQPSRSKRRRPFFCPGIGDTGRRRQRRESE